MTLTIQRTTQVFASGFTGASSPLKGRGGTAQKLAVLIAVGTTISFRFEGSPDGQNWNTITFVKEGTAPATISAFVPGITDTETVAGVYFFTVWSSWFPYFRINVTANTGVTINGLWLMESDVAKPIEWVQDASPAQV